MDCESCGKNQKYFRCVDCMIIARRVNKYRHIELDFIDSDDDDIIGYFYTKNEKKYIKKTDIKINSQK